MLSNYSAAACALALVGLTACSGIGDGNGPKSLEIRIGGQTDSAELFECLTATPQAVVTFDNGIAGDFFSRAGARWTSSDESVLKVSDGSFPAAQEGRLYVNGVLLPVKAGTATLSVKYLNFEDSIEVVVRPSKIELSPYEQTVAQGNLLLMRATAILGGTEPAQLLSKNVAPTERLLTLDLNALGDPAGKWTVARSDGGAPSSSIDPASGLLVANRNEEGDDTVSFAIDFCGRTKSIDVHVTNESLTELELVLASAPDATLNEVAVPPDASVALRAIGHYSGGFTQDFTSITRFAFSDAIDGASSVGFTSVRGTGLATALATAVGQSAELTGTFDPNSSVVGDELTSAPIIFKVLDVALQPDGLTVAPLDSTMLLGTSSPFSAQGSFDGTDGPVTWDLTPDVIWSSSDSALAVVSNSNGQRGVALSSAVAVGGVDVSATRAANDLELQATVETSLVVGASDADAEVAKVLALNVSDDGVGSVSRGTRLSLKAVADVGTDPQQPASTQNITGLVVWSSSDESLAVVSNAIGSRGSVAVVSDAVDQTVTITAHFFNASEQDVVDVVTGTLDLQVNPSPVASDEVK